MEGDPEPQRQKAVELGISIHTLRVEGDIGRPGKLANLFLFLSTPSVWRVTTEKNVDKAHLKISIHTLRVEGDLRLTIMAEEMPMISIHTLRVEGDMSSTSRRRKLSDFYPHPPCGG